MYVWAFSCFTWAVAAQHPRLDERGWDWDLVKQAAVVWAGLLPRPSDQHLNSTLENRRNRLNKLITQLTSQVEVPWLHYLLLLRHLEGKNKNSTKEKKTTALFWSLLPSCGQPPLLSQNTQPTMTSNYYATLQRLEEGITTDIIIVTLTRPLVVKEVFSAFT